MNKETMIPTDNDSLRSIINNEIQAIIDELLLIKKKAELVYWNDLGKSIILEDLSYIENDLVFIHSLLASKVGPCSKPINTPVIEVLRTLNDEEKNLLYLMVGTALDKRGETNND